MQVRRRLAIHVQGYDPRGLAEYYRMFRREFRRTCDLYGSVSYTHLTLPTTERV